MRPPLPTRLMTTGRGWRVADKTTALCLRPPWLPASSARGQRGLVDQTNRSPVQADIPSIWSSPRPYKRIRLTTRKDIERTYPLIAAFIEKPELALPVDEFVVDTASWPQDWDRREDVVQPELLEPPLPVRDQTHAAMVDHVQALGLGDSTTAAMLMALEWKKEHLKGDAPEVPAGFHAHNHIYGLTAAVLLLSLCHNTTSLLLGETGGGNPNMLQDYLLKANYGVLPQPGLQHLERVEMGVFAAHWVHDERHYEDVDFLEYFRYFHRLSSVDAVHMDGVMEYQVNRNLFPPASSNLKKMHIRHSDISSELLSTIIRLPKAFEEFSLSLGGLWHRDGPSSPCIYPKTLGKCLREHASTLRLLDLDLNGALHATARDRAHYHEAEDRRDLESLEALGGEEAFYAGQKDEYFRRDEASGSGAPLWAEDLPDTRPYGYTMGSLHDFAALKSLSVGLKALLGPSEGGTAPLRLAEEPPARLVEALPPGLEYLCLYDYRRGENPDVDGHVDELLAKRVERLPRLREIRGVEDVVPGVAALYPAEGEDDLWRRPEREFDWVEA